MATPRPRPTKMRVLEGNPSRRPLPENEPQPAIPDILPKASEHLSENAKKIWDVMGPRFYRIGLLTEIDIPSFEDYCIVRGNVITAAKEMKATTMTITTDKGNKVQHPIIGILNHSIELADRLGSKFGATPSDRSKVTAAKAEKKSKFYGLIQGGEKVG